MVMMYCSKMLYTTGKRLTDAGISWDSDEIS